MANMVIQHEPKKKKHVTIAAILPTKNRGFKLNHNGVVKSPPRPTIRPSWASSASLHFQSALGKVIIPQRQRKHYTDLANEVSK